jgi:hypothetical protein
MPVQYAESDFISVIEMEDRPEGTQTPTISNSNSRWPESDEENRPEKTDRKTA